MEYFALSGLTNGVLSLSFGFVILLKNWREKANWVFFLMTAAIAAWAFSYWREYSIYKGYEEALFWVRVMSIGSLFIPVFYLHWTSLFLSLQKELRYVIGLAYGIAFAILPFTFSELFIRSVEPKLFFPFWPNPGPLYNFYLAVVYVGFVIFSLFVLLKTYRRADLAGKSQIFYVIVGTVLGFGGGGTNFPLWYGIPLPPYGNFLVATFPFLLGYAALKHGLFNVKVIATELLTFSLWIFLLTRFLVGRTFDERVIDGTLLILVVVAGVFLIRGVMQEVRSREEIERLAKSLEAANRELQKLDESKSEFISMASHQLRAPLSVIKGYLSLLLEESIKPGTAKAKEVMRTVSDAAEQLIKLVGTMLDLSRMESGKIQYKFSEGNLATIIEAVIRELDGAARKKDIKIRFAKGGGEIPNFSFDCDKIREVVTNLVDNAVKYSPRGSTVTVNLKHESFDHYGKVKISVADAGVGIKKADLGKLFAKFSRTEEAKRVDPDGMGIGLYFVKRVVEDHGGKTWAESKGIGKGTTFFVELPIKNR